MNGKRIYKTANKKTVAAAYGWRKPETLVSRVRDKISSATDETLIKQLDQWTGHKTLLPDQVEVIVCLLGTPQDPNALYIEL